MTVRERENETARAGRSASIETIGPTNPSDTSVDAVAVDAGAEEAGVGDDRAGAGFGSTFATGAGAAAVSLPVSVPTPERT